LFHDVFAQPNTALTVRDKALYRTCLVRYWGHEADALRQAIDFLPVPTPFVVEHDVLRRYRSPDGWGWRIDSLLQHRWLPRGLKAMNAVFATRVK
jgi:hypothetical protein